MTQPLSDEQLLDLARQHMVFNSPLSASRVEALADRLGLTPQTSVVDLGCGTGELLLRLCERGPNGLGLDIDQAAIARARERAAALGLDARVSYKVADASQWSGPGDVVVAVGGAHIWGGSAAALSALRGVTMRGGRLLYGDGIWSKAPSDAAQAIFGHLLTLPALVDEVVAARWRPLYVGESTLDEHDVWESDWRAGLEMSGHPDALALADRRRREYFDVYRGVLGFAWLVLLATP